MRNGHWRVDADHSLGSGNVFIVPNFVVTNFDGLYLPLQLQVYADRAIVKHFAVDLMSVQGRERIVVFCQENGGVVALPKPK